MPHMRCWMVIVLMMPVLAFAQPGHAPYPGQQNRAIKALSVEEVEALLRGHGMGLAKAAELNRYPGPRHVLDLAAQLQLSETQRAETQRIFDRMHQEAGHLGALIVDQERELEHLFATATVNPENLSRLTQQIARLQGALRLAHLQAHVEMADVLSRQQIDHYDELRGYARGAGHAPHAAPHRQPH